MEFLVLVAILWIGNQLISWWNSVVSSQCRMVRRVRWIDSIGCYCIRICMVCSMFEFAHFDSQFLQWYIEWLFVCPVCCVVNLAMIVSSNGCSCVQDVVCVVNLEMIHRMVICVSRMLFVFAVVPCNLWSLVQSVTFCSWGYNALLSGPCILWIRI